MPDMQRLPASMGQMAMWFVQQLNPSSYAYNLAISCKVLGNFNIDRFQEACFLIVNRYEALRTHFDYDGDNLFRMVKGQSPNLVDSMPASKLRIVDMPDASEAELNRRLTKEHNRPFNLSKGPLIRFIMLASKKEDHRLLISAHHTILDLTSSYVLFDDLIEAYKELKSGNIEAIQEEPCYSDFVDWQNKTIIKSKKKSGFDFFLKMLRGAPREINLPYDMVRGEQRTNRGDHVLYFLPKNKIKPLMDLAYEHKSTAHVLLQTVYFITLISITKQNDIVMGTAFPGRPPASSIKNIVGNLMNTLPIRLSYEQGMKFSDLLTMSGQVISKVWSYQYLPLLAIMQKLNVERSLSKDSLYQVMFSFQRLAADERKLGFSMPANNDPEYMIEVDDLIFKPGSLKQLQGQMDLAMRVYDTGPQLLVELAYASDVLTKETADKILQQFILFINVLINDGPKAMDEMILKNCG